MGAITVFSVHMAMVKTASAFILQLIAPWAYNPAVHPGSFCWVCFAVKLSFLSQFH